MSRRRREEPQDEEDGWIWGNNRGGGGAPLRDPSGNAVTNLKKVINGEVEVDYSPGMSPKHMKSPDYNNRNHSHNNTYDDGYDSPVVKGLENHRPGRNNRNSNGNNRNDDGYNDNSSNHNSGGNSNTRNRGAFTNPNSNMMPAEKAFQLK